MNLRFLDKIGGKTMTWDELNKKYTETRDKISLERKVDIMKYYDIHVNYDGIKDGAGYSIFVKANVSSEDEALQYAIDNHLFEEDGDEKYVDYVKEIDEEDYHDATGK